MLRRDLAVIAFAFAGIPHRSGTSSRLQHGGQNPVVQAVLPAEPPEVNQEYGDAHWVKVFVTESPERVELHRLVTDDPVVLDEAGETEMEWAILQAGPNGAANELMNEGQIGAGAESVTRRYEFYEYTGAYDPESHEVMCGGDGHCDAPLEGELGNYIGAQMAAINLGVPPTETPTNTPTPTPTPTPIPCVGNCDQNSMVTVEELVKGVNIALGNATLDECPAFDCNGTGQVTVDCLVTAVNAALNGCPPG